MIGMTKSLAAEVATRNMTVNAWRRASSPAPMTDVLTRQAEGSHHGDDSRRPSGAGRRNRRRRASIWPVDEAAYVTGQTMHVNGGMAMI